MRILVVGGTKFIGPHVVRRLAIQGHEVTVYHRGVTEADLPRTVRHVHSPAAQRPVLGFQKEVLEPAPEVIIHMTLIGAQDAQAVVDAAFRGRSRRLVAVSSGDDSYEKILVERAVVSEAGLESVVLRLPKVYGPGGNASLTTVYEASHYPYWRWTHGYVENVAAAIALAALHPGAAGQVYNVGEPYTPTIAERLRSLPPSPVPSAQMNGNFAQDIAYDTSWIRRDLDYEEPITYQEGLRRTLASLAP